MSLASASQIPKPLDEQAFERACTVLWRGLLKDPNVHKNGRRGQKQRGVDLYGCRDGDPLKGVGVQCKLKGPDKVLTEAEVRHEVAEALTFEPPLREYFIVTTAPDDAALQTLARVLTLEQHRAGRAINIFVWGWNTLEDRIAEDADARKAFDPTFTPFAEKLSNEVEAVRLQQVQMQADEKANHDRLSLQLQDVQALLSASRVDDRTAPDAVEAELDKTIDAFRSILDDGQPAVARTQFDKLLDRVAETASGRIRFRIKANIGACLIALGEDAEGARRLLDAYEDAPDEPKAVANRVLGLLILERADEALAFGREALERDPENEVLAGNVVQAARFDAGVVDPFEVVPEGVRDCASVRIAAVEFLRQRDDLRWRDAARDAVARWPDEAYARQAAAEADLDEILGGETFQQTRLLSPQERERVEAAAGVLRDLWDRNKVRKPAGDAEAAGQCANLLVALHGLDALEAAAAVAREGLAFAPDAVFLRRYAAVIAVEAGDDALSAEVVPRLGDDPEDVALALRFYANRRDWPRLAAIHARAEDGLPPTEIVMARTLGQIAELKVAPPVDLGAGLAAVLETTGEDPRAAVVVADFAMDEGLPVVALAAYAKAVSLVGDDSHIARRQMVSSLAVRRRDWSVVADMLDGHIDEGRDSGELQVLAMAFVNESPNKARGLRFFERLPPEIAALPHYQRAVGLFHFNRGALKPAEAALRQTIAESDDLLSYLALFETLRRRNRVAEIRPIVDQVDARALKGSPREKMGYAQAWRDAGDGPSAMAFAYEVLMAEPDDANAALGYFGMVMMDPRKRLIPRSSTVGLDTWVRLESDQSDPVAFVIVADDARPGSGIVTPAHPIVAQAMGLKAGDVFVVEGGVTGDHVWRVAEIKHKYLHALHDVMLNFETRFPKASGLWRMRMEEGDIQPALDMIKRAGEADRTVADLYLVQHFPLNMVASHVTGSTMAFADYIRSLDLNIDTTLGDEAERTAAYRVMKEKRAAGVVLDTYAAWTIASLGVMDAVFAVFGSVAIPASTVDELRTLSTQIAPGDKDSLSIGWVNGQFFRQSLSRKETRARAELINGWIQAILDRCEVLPTVAPDDLNAVGHAALDAFGPAVLDAAFAAGDDRVLMSEDRHFRSAAAAILGTSSVWLQPMLNLARDEGHLTPAAHAAALVGLAWRRHGHVAGDLTSLLETLKADDSLDLADLRQVCRYLGGPNAEIASHLEVSCAFLNAIWSEPELPRLKVMKATGVVLTAMTREPSRDWAAVLAEMRDRLIDGPRQYAASWTVGHFLPLDRLRQADRAVTVIQLARRQRALRDAS